MRPVTAARAPDLDPADPFPPEPDVTPGPGKADPTLEVMLAAFDPAPVPAEVQPWNEWFAWRRRVVADPRELGAWVARAGGATGDGVAWLPEGLEKGKALDWLTASVAERDLRLRWRP
jgi:hypothetical protein